MPDDSQNIEPETQHEKKQAATKDVRVDEEDVRTDDQQETQHAKKRGATQTDDD